MQDLDQILERLADSYEETPYFSNAFKWCAPGYIRAAAHLYGVKLPEVATARILEIGCAAGGNCLPAAFLYPKATIVGIDISVTQIREGQGVIKRAGLKNIQLYAMCLTEITPEFGQFDYIIMHGVLSWVPEEIQPALFRVCQQNLSPKGAAYISFNTYPGWKAHELLREMMLWHSAEAASTKERIQKSRELLPFLMQSMAAHNPLQSMLHQIVKNIPTSSNSDYYLAHEYLELHNNPMYLTDFACLAQQYGLRHVGDVEVREDLLERHGLHINEDFVQIAHTKDRLEQQQLLDYAVGRSFRKSLVLRESFAAKHVIEPNLDRLPELLFAGWFKKQDTEFYQTLTEAIRIESKAVQAMLDLLGQSWPRPVSGYDLKAFARQQGENEVQAALKYVFLFVPIEICCGYEDLPYCLQDYYVGLVNGVGQLALDRPAHGLHISDFNAWYSSSIEHFTEFELFVIQCLKEGKSASLAASALAAKWREQKEPNFAVTTSIMSEYEEALDLVEEIIARLRKYAMYV